MSVKKIVDIPVIVSALINARGQAIFALLVFVTIVFYSVTTFFYRPYDGFVFGYDGVVTGITEGGPADEAGFLVGDKVIAIDGRDLEPFLITPLYKEPIIKAETVTYEIQRGDQVLTISMVLKHRFDNPQLGPMILVMSLSFAFWLLGVGLSLFASRSDIKARLVGSWCLIVGLAAAAGGPGGASYMWGAATIMKVSFVLLGFLIVVLHLYFPEPIFSMRFHKRVIWAIAMLSAVLVTITIADDWIYKPSGSVLTVFGIEAYIFVYGFSLLAAFMAIALLTRNYFFSGNTEARRQTGIILWGTILGFAPFAILTLLPMLLLGEERAFVQGSYTVLTLVFIPLAYTYIIYQRKLLRIDFIINRIVVFFVFGFLVLVLALLIFVVFSLVFNVRSVSPLLGGLLAVVLSLSSGRLQKPIQRGVNKVLYGGHYDYVTVTSSLSSHLARTLERDTLGSLLTESLPEQMGIKQVALFFVRDECLELARSANAEISEPVLSCDDDLWRILLDAGVPMRAQNLWGLLSPAASDRWQQFAWAEIFVPIIFEASLRGVLVLGPRLASDVYSDDDLRIIATVSQQSALAAANVRLVEDLRATAQQMRDYARRLTHIDEEHRKSSARELHDVIIPELFYLMQSLSQRDYELAVHVQEIMAKTRQIIKSQRPPALDKGLMAALQELADDTQERVGEKPLVIWNNDVSREIGLSDGQATHLFRIAQESITNTIRHADAQTIIVHLKQVNGYIRLSITDDGIGGVVREKMFGEGPYCGLLGMQERADTIGATMRIVSPPREGTTIIVEMPCTASV